LSAPRVLKYLKKESITGVSMKTKYSDELNSKITLFEAWVESQMAYKGLPGLAIGVVYDQELVWSRGFGFSNTELQKPVQPDTLFRIASITKLFTSTALLQLRDAGKLQLDDPVVKHLPWFKIQKREEDAPQVLLRHLITHTSGLPRESASPYWDTAEFPTYDEVKNKLPEQEQVLRPGTRWKYSNLALSIAGDVIAAVSGMPYEDYIEQNILQPLEMTDTFVRTLPEDHPRFASGYGRRLPDGTRSIRPFGDCKGITPAANMATTVEDLAKFAMLQFREGPAGGKQILSGHTLKEMHAVHWLDDNWQFGWGWGFMIHRLKDKTYVGHGGSLMGFRTNLLVCPEDKTAVVALTNADDGDPLFYSDKVISWVLPAVVKQFAPAPEAKKPEPNWDRYTGKYRSPWGDMQIIVYEGQLVAIDPSFVDPSLDMTRLIPVAEHTFRMEMKSGSGAVGELAVFEFDDAGKVVRLRTGDNYTYRIENW
jgi:D-alanyl-D-alanine carboxypeptidase